MFRVLLAALLLAALASPASAECRCSFAPRVHEFVAGVREVQPVRRVAKLPVRILSRRCGR